MPTRSGASALRSYNRNREELDCYRSLAGNLMRKILPDAVQHCLWCPKFVTAEGTGKLRSLGADPHVNLSYYKDRTREWISVSGLATISRDRQKLHELYAPDWRNLVSGRG